MSTTGTAPSIQTPTQRRFIAQNFVLIWLHSSIDESDTDYEHSLSQLQRNFNTIDTFTNADECVNFLTKIGSEKVFMIVPGDLVSSTVPHIHDMSQLHAVYVFSGNKGQYKEWTKVKGVFTEIDALCDALKRDTEQCNFNAISISHGSGNLNELDASFMYTQLLKETLIKIPYDDEAKTELTDFYRELYGNSKERLKIIDEFERNYYLHSPIWWFTRECFIDLMLNRALQTLDVGILMKMGFFLRDVHQQIEQLHSQTGHHQGVYIVYRGQNMSNADFKVIQQSKGGLLGCNSFLSTIMNQNVALQLARDALHDPESVGILFHMIIDRSITTVPFALLDNFTYNKEPVKELLFSTHTVFKIGEIKPIEDRLWQVELTMVSDSVDPQHKQLTELIREEIQGSTGWDQLGKLLMSLGQFDKADEAYQHLLQETPKSDEKELAYLDHQFGRINRDKGDYQGALDSYQKALAMEQKSLPPNHPSLAITYTNIGELYNNMGESSKAFECYQKALEIKQNSLPPNHPDLATTYTNIGEVYKNMGEYARALEYFQKALKIEQNSLPPNHPTLGTTYSNIGKVYTAMGEYSKALPFYQRAVEIGQNTLPENHPDLLLYQQQLVEVQKNI